MGYSTEFMGHLVISPRLSPKEIDYLKRFSETRHCQRKEGPYYVGPKLKKDKSNWTESVGQDYQSPSMIDSNAAATGQPGLWCQWIPSDDGTKIMWDGGEKFYDAFEWMQYLVEHFFANNPKARLDLKFLKPHKLNGEIVAQGDDPRDRWKIVAKNNVLTKRRMR